MHIQISQPCLEKGNLLSYLILKVIERCFGGVHNKFLFIDVTIKGYPKFFA